MGVLVSPRKTQPEESWSSIVASVSMCCGGKNGVPASSNDDISDCGPIVEPIDADSKRGQAIARRNSSRSENQAKPKFRCILSAGEQESGRQQSRYK